MDANAAVINELVGTGLERREARWLVDEFGPGENPRARERLDAAATRRRSGEPLQYIIGHWPFRSLELYVDERVLIPRPESEELVTIALDELAANDVENPLIVDLGCGSGAIGLALLDELRHRGRSGSLVAIDRSRDALDVARRNASAHQLHDVSFVESSWFDALDESLRARIDLIVANPPYVSEREFLCADPVLRYEPREALVASDRGPDEGFADLAHIIGQARAWLAPRGVLVCEHGECHRAAALGESTSSGFRDVRDLDDLSGRARVLVARA